MEILLGIIFSTLTKENSQAESDEQISWLLQQLDKLGTDSLTAGSRESQASACIGARIPCSHTLLHPSRGKNPMHADVITSEGLTVNLYPQCHCPSHPPTPCLPLVLNMDAQVGRDTDTLPLKPMGTTCVDLPGFSIAHP